MVLFPSSVVGSCCVGLGVACTFLVLLKEYDVTVVYRDVSHVGVDMSLLIGCSE